MKTLSPTTRAWMLAGAGLLLLNLAAAQLHGMPLTAFSDMEQVVLGGVIAGGICLNLRRARQTSSKVFWVLMAMGSAMWWSVQITWAVFDLVLKRDLPTPYIGDVLVFVHIVPMMAAFAMQPQGIWNRRENRARVLDCALLISWWVYLYMFAVIPWQYVSLDVPRYCLSFNILYIFELVVLQIGIGVLWSCSTGSWRLVYLHYLIAGSIYAVAINAINFALDAHAYNSGSLYDVFLEMALFYFGWVGWHAASLPYEPAPLRRRPRGVWGARMAMVAILSIPAMAVCALLMGDAGTQVRQYRLLLSLAFILLLTAMLFFKQHLLDRELIRLLDGSHRALNDLRRVQAQLLQTEKLASIGRLVAGAAHEINNPLTAILGYSDMLSDEPDLREEHRLLATKILQQARRTKALVTNLLTFAKQSPGQKSPVDINAILRNAVRLRELGLDQHQIRVQRELANELPPILGDEYQLLQVCRHILDNAVDALIEVGGGTILVSSSLREDFEVIEIADTGAGIQDPARIFDPFYTTKPVGQGVGLGLSACFGIVQEHGGEITCANHVAGGAIFRISLPVCRAERPIAAEATLQIPGL